MKCPLCTGDMRSDSVRRFDFLAVILWTLAAAASTVGGFFLLLMSSEGFTKLGPQQLGIVVGVLLVVLPASLVVSSSPVYACAKCGHWVNRT